VDPVEAAWELLDERLAPFRDEVLVGALAA